MRTSKVLVVLFILTTILNKFEGSFGSSAIPCKSCNDYVDSQIDKNYDLFLTYEPFTSTASSFGLCKEVKVTGMSSMKRKGLACYESPANGPVVQKVELAFSNMNTTCRINSLEDVMKLAHLPLLIKSTFFGTSAAAENYINGYWENVILNLEYTKDADGKFTVLNADITNENFNGLKLWCQGESLNIIICEGLTKIDFIKSALGFAFKLIFQHVSNENIKDNPITEILECLYCPNEIETESEAGEDAEDAEEAEDAEDAVDAEDAEEAEDTEDTEDAEDTEDTEDTEDAVDAEDPDDAKEAETTTEINENEATKGPPTMEPVIETTEESPMIVGELPPP